ncbi:MAG: Holliday junction branch migration protein RuvA [Patescibacteria group bacterium]
MIGYLKGNIRYRGSGSRGNDYLVIDVNNVGYKVEVIKPMMLKEDDSEIEVFIYSDVGDKYFRLFGFPKKEDLFLFEKLISVSGIGPKGALNILSSHQSQILVKAIIEGDSNFLSSTPGLGKKVADRIVLELRGKLDNFQYEGVSLNKDVQDALISLGFSYEEISAISSDLVGISDTKDAVKKGLILLKGSKDNNNL